MYCSTCGGAVASSLSYCNHYGARLSGPAADADRKPAELFPDSLVWAIVSVFVVGLGGTIGLMAVMKEAPVRELGIANERALPEPSLSVTDRTTRTLEPAYRERTRE